MDVYLQRYYSARYNDSVQNNTATTLTAEYYDRLKRREVLKFAYGLYAGFGSSFSECAQGEILGPQNPETAERTCIKIPERLEKRLGTEQVEHGHRTGPGNCPRFTTTDGCVTIQNPDVCVWTWLSEKCDEKPPGLVKTDACDSADVITQCETWHYILSKPHPTFNCDQILEYCTSPNGDCVAVRGQYIIEPTNWTAHQANQVLDTPFKTTLQQWSGVDASKITINLEEAGAGYPARTLRAYVCMKNLPPSYIPLPGLRTDTATLLEDIQAQTGYNPNNGIASLDWVPNTFRYLATTDMDSKMDTLCGATVPTVP